MRATDEIIAKYREWKGEDWLGVIAYTLLAYVPMPEVKPFLREGVTEAEWGKPRINTPEAITEALVGYLAFAFTKALGHRGISASRSVQRVQCWLWMLGDDEMLAFARDNDNYAEYGMPVLVAVATKYGAKIPDGTRVRRMAQGLPCHDGCDEGC